MLATSDSERIAVDHVAKAIDTGSRTSMLSQNLVSTLNAIKLLRSKIRFLIDIVNNSPEVKKNHEFMRRLNNICNQLPISLKSTYDKEVFTDYSDIAAINNLAAVTKGFELLNGLIDDFKVIRRADKASGRDGIDQLMMMGSDPMMQEFFHSAMGGGRKWK